jgi:hypothetical protein
VTRHGFAGASEWNSRVNSAGGSASASNDCAKVLLIVGGESAVSPPDMA